MSNMDHVLENKFLNKEGASKQALHEDDYEIEMISGNSREEVQFQVFDSFVKEKYSLLAYVRALVVYSAKLQGLDDEKIQQIYPEEVSSHHKEVKSEQDVMNFKNRIIIIVRVY